MEKLKMETKDLVQENIEKLAKIFPGVITEVRDEQGNLTRAVDFELLKQELSDRVVEMDKERYQLTWPGKKEAMLIANLPINKTLRPVKEESVDWDNTGNIYIEGDNLDVLKILQESYLNKVKCIYIDPPYNTGKDFIYKDNFKQSREEYLADSGQVDEDGNRLFQNTEYNGRFHSDWLSMMYPRLKLARNLLREDGVIFISIDDNEVHNLRKICDEVFGERNFIASIVWQRAYAPVNMNKYFSPNHDFALVYAKCLDKFNLTKLPRSKKQNKDYKNIDNDPRGPWKPGNPSVGPAVEKNIYEITLPSGRKVLPPKGRSWLYSKEKYEEMVKDNRIYFGKDGNSVWAPKLFLSEVSKGITPLTLWTYDDVGHSQDATKDLKKIFNDNSYFEHPKPVNYLKRMVHLGSKANNDDIILDFFSGSATTAHAVMQLNAEDGGNRRYIMVQLPEPCDEDSEAYKAGFKNVSEIGKERIRRAARKIKEETGAEIDYGFRVFKVDSSNMKDVYYRPGELLQKDLFSTLSNIKEDRIGDDILVQVMLEWGLEISLPMEKRSILGKKVHFVAGNSLVACFDEVVSEGLVREIAKEKPLRVVFRDSSFADDAARINVDELFKILSPTTEIKVI